jgi:hypothetical protein
MGAKRVEVALRDEDEGMQLLPWIEADNFNPGYLMRGSISCRDAATRPNGGTTRLLGRAR